ncbi:TPA: hypothetical protein O8586_001302 [Staphylococcus aureus]|nr:hypothetical protein [Staphylococcus aureus]HDC6511828.1 hypothetical protein [Staphylococcus aureus]
MNDRIKFYVYNVSTPILKYEKTKNDWMYMPTYFNFNILLYSIKSMLYKKKIDRIHTYKESKTIVLNEFYENYNQYFAYGEFLTIAHGYEASSVEIEKLTKTKDFKKNEGILNKVHFFIDKRNGYMYVEHDRNSVLTMHRIQSYFNDKSNNKYYYKKFNALNKNEFQIDTHRSLININLLEPLDFIQQIKSIKKMKNITIPLNVESHESENEGVVSKLKEKAKMKKVGEYDTKIVLDNFNFSKMSKELLNFIKFLKASNSFGELKVTGTINQNITRVFTPETSTRDIIFQVNKNINGWADKNEVYRNLKSAIDNDSQLDIVYLTLGVKEVDINNAIFSQLNARLNSKKKKNKVYNIKSLKKLK